MLKEFFAVTSSHQSASLYHVGEDDGSQYHSPYAEKLALRGSSKVAVGERLRGREMLAICKQLVCYTPEGGGYLCSVERRIEMVNTRYWGAESSLIVALFLTEEVARQCFESSDLQPADERWLDETKMVIEAIGVDHPSFEVCRWPGLALTELPPLVPVETRTWPNFDTLEEEDDDLPF